ncbi:amidase [Rhizobium sullae]|uniref:Amidase n=1 Tax=Rhizobium sullae TaxID=50338 RepID=A0A4R3PWV3_RHISU|nr:amidase [Rhizobium sullae]TCU07593.1 aspartyl-tRNA(Asn)/glutamyl-tRNA(Gln) amidotransferase subunit A [Rhizobium sullae]UWU19139.1 amidase [Rhizobium sullae]
MTDLASLSAQALTQGYRSGELSPVEVLSACLERIDRFEPMVNAFVFVDREGALKAARASERRWRRGDQKGPADGVPATIKDNIAWSGFPNRQGSLLTAKTPAAFDAPAVARLKEAGCVLLGKTTMPEFGWKGVGDSPLTGITRNPWDLSRTSGGSSAGAAVAALLGMGVLHLGTDGAGSIRIPASFCGVVGFKPSYGRVPSYPLSAMGGLAHVGPIARSVSDVATMLSVISQPDHRDPTAWNLAPPDYEEVSNQELSGLRIGCSIDLGFADHLDPEIVSAVKHAAAELARLGASVDEIDLALEDPRDILATLWEAGAALLLRNYARGDWSRCDPGMARAAERGREISGACVIEALTRKRVELSASLSHIFESYDLLITPQMPTVALPAGMDTPPRGFAGVDEWGEDWTRWSPFTYPFNITQLPAVSVPCGHSSEGLPIGLQIVGPMRADELVLRAARAFEAAMPPAVLDIAGAGLGA